MTRGDDVTFLTSAPGTPTRSAPIGAEPAPAARTAADYDDSSFDADLPGRAETSGIARVNFDVKHVFVRPMPHQSAALEELMAAHHFDAIIADAFFLGMLPLLLGDSTSRPPVLTYTTTPLFLTSRDTAPGGTGIAADAPAPLGRLRNRALNVVVQKVLLRPAHRAAEPMLAAMGLPTLPVFVLDSGVLADRVIAPDHPRVRVSPQRPARSCAVRRRGHPLPADDFVAPPWWEELRAAAPSCTSRRAPSTTPT